MEIIENKNYLEDQLITYLGNKRLLLPFIGEAIVFCKTKLKKEKLDMLDLFSGTGIVSRYFKQFSNNLIVNDLETYSRISNECYLNTNNINIIKIEKHIKEVNDYTVNNLEAGFITELYSPKNEKRISKNDRCFYTRRNAMFIDTARSKISEYADNIQLFLLAPLLSKASVHTNTSGVFKGFYKNKKGVGQYGGEGKNALKRILGDIELTCPVYSNFDCNCSIFQEDANELVKNLTDIDVAYFDPPYNQHPYGSNYFMLNLISDYEVPVEISKVSGIPQNWNRSSYNKKASAEESLINLIKDCPSKFIIISYNSEGIIPFEDMVKTLKSLGKIKVLEKPYNTFKGSRNLINRVLKVSEYLFIIQK